MAPLRALFEANATAVEMLGDVPPFLHGDPDIRAVIYCHAKESDRKRTTLDHLRRQFFPQHADELGLPWWEKLLRITVAPVGWTVEQRRAAVIAHLRRANATTSGLSWAQTVTTFVGPGWTYAEHDPDDPGSPPPYTIRVTLPFSPGSSPYAQIEALLRDITPAHLDLALIYEEGFELDSSQLDQEGLV